MFPEEKVFATQLVNVRRQIPRAVVSGFLWREREIYCDEFFFATQRLSHYRDMSP